MAAPETELNEGGAASSPRPSGAGVVRAAVMKAPGVVEVEAFPRPKVEPGAVLMQVQYSGICGTDKHTFRGETIQYAGTPHERRLEYPLICGHENVGVVLATGSFRARTSPAATAGSAGRAFPTTRASGSRTTATASTRFVHRTCSAAGPS